MTCPDCKGKGYVELFMTSQPCDCQESKKEKPSTIKDKQGTTFWYLRGKIHRENGPAIEWADGTKSWYSNRKLHRKDGPAVEYTNGLKYWVLDGKYI